MAASGDWIEVILELVLRALLGLLKHPGDDWWPFACLVATAALVVIGVLLSIYYRRRVKRRHGLPDRGEVDR